MSHALTSPSCARCQQGSGALRGEHASRAREPALFFSRGFRSRSDSATPKRAILGSRVTRCAPLADGVRRGCFWGPATPVGQVSTITSPLAPLIWL